MKFDKLILEIENHEVITLFHHEYPDFDSLGAQYGLYYWLTHNFKNKKIFCVGKNEQKKFTRLFKNMTQPTDAEVKKSFAIVCDVDGTNRVDDQRFLTADKVLVIDHHIQEINKGYSNYRLVDVNASSTAELIGSLILKHKNKYKIPYETLECFFLGIVTDTGRFLHSNTSLKTYKILQEFKKLNINEQKIYNELYVDSMNSVKLRSFIISNFSVTKSGVAYYYLTNENMSKFNISYSEGKEYVFSMSGIEEVKIWTLITYDVKGNYFRVSLRSREYPVRTVATKWGGGGHNLAAGCRLSDINDLTKLISDLDNLIK